MTSETVKAHRGGPLDLLRFLAAAFVVLYHYAEDAPVALDRVSPVFASGWVATDFFLMLSGYVMARAYGAKVQSGAISAPAFLAKRLLRVWPAHAIVLALLAAIVVAARLAHVSAGQSHGYDWAWLPAELFLTQAWGLGVPGGWNLPAWSLSALVVCYAGFPAFWRWLASLRPLTALALGVASVSVGQLLAHSVGFRLADLPLQMGVLRALPLFALGCAIARFHAFEGGRQDQVACYTVIGCAVAAAILEPTLGAIFGVAALIAWLGPSKADRPWPWAAAGAALSFPLFITHFASGELYFHVARSLLPDLAQAPVTGWMVWAGGVGFALVFAAAFNRFVDRPVQRLAEDLIERRARRRAMASAMV